MKGHGVYWLIPAVGVFLIAYFISQQTPIPIHYRAEALEDFYTFLQQPHPPGAFQRRFCDKGMCISLKEGQDVAYAFSTLSPEEALLYLEGKGVRCRTEDSLYVCETKDEYPMPEGYRRVSLHITLSE